MEILIEDIPKEGLQISATEKTLWLSEVVGEVFGEIFKMDDRAHLKVSINRIGGNVNLDGELALTFHPDCDRCLVNYQESSDVKFHTVLAPLYESEKQREHEEGDEAQLVKEDLEFGYYEGDRFDLADLVREQLLLCWPMKHLCKEDCRGLCQRCGRDLNEGPCGCGPKD